MTDITHEILTPAQVADIQRGGKELAPGIWEDRHGSLHFSVPDLLAALGWPNDAAHQDLVQEAIVTFLRETWPETQVVLTDMES